MEPDLAPMIEDEGAEASMDELLCPICLDLLHRPHSLQPCQHLFCDPCLRRLAEARINKCPVCRSPIEDCHLDQELHESIEDRHHDVYIQRQEAEMISGIFNEPLPPVRHTVAEIENEWVEEWITVFEDNLIDRPEPRTVAEVVNEWVKLVTLMVLMLVGIILLLNLIIQLIVQWLRSLAVHGEDQTPEPQI